MTTQTEPVSLSLLQKGKKAGRVWFDARGRHLGTWAFIFNRLSGLLLAAYLFVHLAVISLLVWSPDAYNRFIRLAESPPVLLFDIALAGMLLYHSLNGLRIILLSLGVGLACKR